jgi:purine-cytosine permease-like protein
MPERRYRLDQKRGRLVLGSLEIPVPRSRMGRIATGTALVGGGFLGFLPILGFWMVPLGLVVLSHDIPAVRRRRRRAAVWWYRRKGEGRQSRDL